MPTLNVNARKDGKLRKELAIKIENWLISFHRLDPRYKILRFFNQVASEGADDFVDEEEDDYGITDEDFNLPGRDQFVRKDSVFDRIKKRMGGKIFDKSSILTVWRPCSNDAMRKMMEGTGVGKGLDIKGKSAKKGLLSAFVPFLQISEEADKHKIMNLAYTARMRVYFHNEKGRKEVWGKLHRYADDHDEDDDEDKASAAEQIDDLLMLNEYAPHKYGIELGQRLFWYAVVVEQDISRTDDPETDGTATGRASSPGFQDANMDTLKKGTKFAISGSKGPIPVLLQHDQKNHMRPQTLLVAYEENGGVMPVVSDFDCFLLGWRREALWFGCNLPREQEDLMMWCVDRVEEVLSDCHMSADTWTVRWLDIKKEAYKAGINFDMPPYGYGDPKSYGIMEKAALRLKDTGAVRHGSECFNYGFPQEIDDSFLLVSDTLKGVPWRYLDVTQLQNLLLKKIDEGFVFPLNPKWILCDPGWKDVYDHLMNSDALYADSCRDVWYPPGLGIRKKIDRIYKKYPKGFQRGDGRVSFIAAKGYSPLRQCLEEGEKMSGNAAFELAELELDNYSRKQTLARQIAKASEQSTDDEGGGHDSDPEVRRRQSNNKMHKLELYRRDKKELERMQKHGQDVIEHTKLENESLRLQSEKIPTIAQTERKRTAGKGGKSARAGRSDEREKKKNLVSFLRSGSSPKRGQSPKKSPPGSSPKKGQSPKKSPPGSSPKRGQSPKRSPRRNNSDGKSKKAPARSKSSPMPSVVAKK